MQTETIYLILKILGICLIIGWLVTRAIIWRKAYKIARAIYHNHHVEGHMKRLKVWGILTGRTQKRFVIKYLRKPLLLPLNLFVGLLILICVYDLVVAKVLNLDTEVADTIVEFILHYTFGTVVAFAVFDICNFINFYAGFVADILLFMKAKFLGGYIFVLRNTAFYQEHLEKYMPFVLGVFIFLWVFTYVSRVLEKGFNVLLVIPETFVQRWKYCEDYGLFRWWKDKNYKK